jgi:hypothetical protein
MTIDELRTLCLALPGTHEKDHELLRGIIEGAWRRTAPKAVARACEEGQS